MRRFVKRTWPYVWRTSIVLAVVAMEGGLIVWLGFRLALVWQWVGVAGASLAAAIQFQIGSILRKGWIRAAGLNGSLALIGWLNVWGGWVRIVQSIGLLLPGLMALTAWPNHDLRVILSTAGLVIVALTILATRILDGIGRGKMEAIHGVAEGYRVIGTSKALRHDSHSGPVNGPKDP